MGSEILVSNGFSGHFSISLKRHEIHFGGSHC